MLSIVVPSPYGYQFRLTALPCPPIALCYDIGPNLASESTKHTLLLHKTRMEQGNHISFWHSCIRSLSGIVFRYVKTRQITEALRAL
jgi:hypothetical protein